VTAFRYKAADSKGQIFEGSLEASDPDSAARLLQAEGKIPLQIRDARQSTPAASSKRRRGQRVRASSIDYFTLELATLLDAGLPLGKALVTLVDTSTESPLTERIRAISQAVHNGKSLSQALEESGPEFDQFYCNMVRAGESSGELNLTLMKLAEFRQRRRETQREIFSALLYPSLLLVLAIVAIAVLLAFVVPQFTEMFADAGRQLPLLTRIVAAAGTLVTDWWWAMLIGLGGLFFWLQRDWASPEGRARWDRWLVQLPLVGPLVQKIQAARFARTLGTLLQNGVPLVNALKISQGIVSNVHIASALASVTQRVREGESLSKPLADRQVMPPLASRLIDIGESSGKLEQMLLQLADIFENDVRVALKRLFTLAEPVIIIAVAVIISVIIFSVVLVILESNELVF